MVYVQCHVRGIHVWQLTPINHFTVWLSKMSRDRTNVSHGSSESGHVVGRIRYRSYW